MAFVSEPPLANSVTSCPCSVEPVGEERDDELDPAVAGRRDREPGRRDLGDLHESEHTDEVGATGRSSVIAHVAAVDLDGERVAEWRRRCRHAGRGPGLLDLAALGRHGARLPARPVLPRHAVPLGAAPPGERAVARAAGRDDLDPFSAAFVLRDQPRPGLADSAADGVPQPLRRPRHARRRHRAQLRPRTRVLRARVLGGRRLRRPLRGEGGSGREDGRPDRPRWRTPHHLDVPAGCVLPRCAPRLLRAADVVADPRVVRDRRPAGRRVVDVPPAHAGRRRRGGHPALPLRSPGRAVDAGGAPRGVAAQPAGDHARPRRLHRAARPLHRGPRRAASLRSRASRPHRRRGGCTVVHDAVRARQPAHVVDGDDRRLRPRARARCRRWRATRGAR